MSLVFMHFLIIKSVLCLSPSLLSVAEHVMMLTVWGHIQPQLKVIFLPSPSMVGLLLGGREHVWPAQGTVTLHCSSLEIVKTKI